MQTDYPTIMIVGAARSGTHLIGSCLRERIDCAYAGEVNDLWRQVPGVPKHDALPVHLATDEVCERLRSRFEALRVAQGGDVLMEKTAANALRMPFVYRVFPDAWYIHIVRDGRDVACSARKKYLGDTRKLTSGASTKREDKRQRASRLVGLVRHKLTHGASPLQMLRHPGRPIAGALNVLGLRKRTLWGPRFPGMAEVYRSHPLLQVGGMQWCAAVDAVESFVQTARPSRFLEVRFESFVNSPDETLDQILAFLEPSGVRAKRALQTRVQPPATTWRDQLDDHERVELEQVIAASLSRYGYH